LRVAGAGASLKKWSWTASSWCGRGSSTGQPAALPGRPAGPHQKVPEGLRYATIHKNRAGNRVVSVETRLVYGTEEALAVALENSSVSERVTTFFVERHNGTDRNRNGRKARKTYCFSKDWCVHEAASRLTMYSYNFCWAVRTLRERGPDGKW
jgi:hypothetical protein